MNVMYQFNTRGCLEPSSILVEDFEVGIWQIGACKGIMFVRLKEDYGGQKNRALSLKNPVVNADNSKKKTLPAFYSSDPLSCFQTVRKLIMWCPDSKTCTDIGGRRLFRKPASVADLLSWSAAGKPWRLSRSVVVGKSRVNPIIKKIAKWCGYDNADRCTAHGQRRAGLSKSLNSGTTAPAVMVQLGGHSLLSTTARYNLPDQEAYDRTIRTKDGSPTAIKKEMAEAARLPNPSALFLDHDGGAVDDDGAVVDDGDVGGDRIEYIDEFEDSKPAATVAPGRTLIASNAIVRRESRPPSTNDDSRAILPQVTRSFDDYSPYRHVPPPTRPRRYDTRPPHTRVRYQSPSRYDEEDYYEERRPRPTTSHQRRSDEFEQFQLEEDLHRTRRPPPSYYYDDDEDPSPRPQYERIIRHPPPPPPPRRS